MLNDICKKCNKKFKNSVKKILSSDPNKHICNECLQEVYESLISEIGNISENIKTCEKYKLYEELAINNKIYNILLKVYLNYPK